MSDPRTNKHKHFHQTGIPKKRQTPPPPCHLLRTEKSNFCTWWHQMELHKCQNEWQPLWRFENTLNVFHVRQDEKTDTQRKETSTLLKLHKTTMYCNISPKQRENNSSGVKLHVLNLLFACRMMRNNFRHDYHETARKTTDLYSCQEG